MPLSPYSVIVAFSGTTAVLLTRGSALIGSSLPYRVSSDLFAVVYARICFFFRQFSRLCRQFLFLRFYTPLQFLISSEGGSSSGLIPR